MTRWQVLQLLCEHLRTLLLGDAATQTFDPDAWPAAIEASSYHYVTPALAWSLRGKREIPEDVRDYLGAFLELNRTRNELLLEDMASTIRALNGAGVTPVLLKGAAALVDNLYPHPGIRILTDLDYLVPEEQLGRASETLASLGFRPVQTTQWVPADDLPIQLHPDRPAGIDVHKALVPRAFDPLVPLTHFWTRAQPIHFRGASALLPCPTDRVAHNIVHSQLKDGEYRRGVPQLRQLLELAMLQTRFASDIEWGELQERFRGARLAGVLTDTVGLSHQLLGCSLPQSPLGASREGALERFRAAVDDPEGQWRARLYLLFLQYWRSARANPLRALNVLRPSSWPPRLDNMRRRTRAPKW